jgi:hypothetical protein
VEGGRCAATEDRLPIWQHASYTQDHDESVNASFGDDQYRLWFRERGTELVRVSHGADWTRELSAVGIPHSERASIVAVPGGVIVFVGPFPENEDDDTALVMRLAAGSGETEWEQRVYGSNTVNFQGAVYNGRYVVAVIGNGLYAFDPAQGEIAWQLGA